MQNIKLLHIADMHLGSAFGRLNSDMVKVRRNETVYSCIRSIKDAIDCDMLLISGDVFDSGNIQTTILDSFLSAIDFLGDVPVFYSCGNHDSYYTEAVTYCIKNSPSNLHIFSPDKLSCYTIDSLNARVYGASFSAEFCDETMIDSNLKLDKSYINILCMHGDLSKGIYNYIDTKLLATLGFDYAALGHVHSFSGIQKYDSCYYAYPGIHDGRGFDECGDKGYIKGSISKGSANLDFIFSSTRTYLDDKIDISDFKNEYELIDVINSLCPNETEISRFKLIGDNKFGKNIDTRFLTKNCKAFWSEFIDETKMAVFPEDYVGYSGLKGACANEALKLINESSNDKQKEMIKKAFGLLIEIFENR